MQNNTLYKAEWKPPFTNKRYLHPPFSENMFTMWPDLRVICGDVVEETRGYRSAGFRLLIGQELLSPDFTAVEYHTRPDGAPVHTLSQNVGDYSVHMESFCDICRVPACYTEFTIENNTDHEIRDVISLLPRTGREDHLVGTETDGYAHYDSNVCNWGLLPTNWRLEGALLTDGEYSILTQLRPKLTPVWQGDEKGLVWYKRRLLKLSFALQPGEKTGFRCAFRHGEIGSFNYAAEKEKALAFWAEERKRLRSIPGGAAYSALVRNLVTQCLQMFSYPVGKDYVLPRQGGLQRVIWPVEGIEFLMALDRLGDFSDYTEAAYDTYFFTLQAKEGEDAGSVQNLSGQRWGSITGASCWGCARHLLYRDSGEAFDKFKEPLWLAFCWMQRQRAKSYASDCAGKGLFPAMQSCDWPGAYQSWCLTDATNLLGMKWLSQVFTHFGDSRAREIQDAYRDYMACMKRVLADEIAKNTLDGEILLTNKVGEQLPDPPTGAYFVDGPVMLMRAGVIAPCGEVAKLVEAYYRNRGLMKNGLTGLMNDGLIFQGHNADPWCGHTWYLSSGDMAWFYNWLWGGERDKAWETLSAQLKWGMSPQYYLLERYADNDPYWTPWMPNASANGRLLMMLADWFETSESV